MIHSIPYLQEITAILTFIFLFATFFADNKKYILRIQAIALLFYACHVYLLGLFIPALFLGIQVFRNFFFSIDIPRIFHTIFYVILVFALIIINFTLNNEDSLSWLPMIGSIIGTTALWMKNTKHIRFIFFLSTLPWLYYIFKTGTIFTIILQLTLFSSVLINIIRFDILKYK